MRAGNRVKRLKKISFNTHLDKPFAALVDKRINQLKALKEIKVTRSSYLVNLMNQDLIASGLLKVAII